MLALQSLAAAPESLLFLDTAGATASEAGGLALNVGLSNGVLLRTEVDKARSPVALPHPPRQRGPLAAPPARPPPPYSPMKKWRNGDKKEGKGKREKGKGKPSALGRALLCRSW